MAVRAGAAYADIVPRLAEGFAKDLDRQVAGPVDDTSKKVGGSIGGLAGKVAALAGGAFAAKGIFDFTKGAVEAAVESNKIAAQTEQVIKSTGGAAKVTAGQIGDLATAISNKTGVDDEAIQQGQNLLLTFTNIRNEAGKGNDIFNQSTQTLVDMAAAMGTDVKGGAVQLGKALNDPIAGIGALSRVGVTFTDQQKEQIKTLVNSGKTMDAQKIILAELNKEFGGSAAAQATAGQKLSVTWGNVQEQLGNALLPVLDKVATFLADNLPGAIDFVMGVIDSLRPFIEGLTKAFGDGGLAGAVGHLVDAFQDAWPSIQSALGSMLASLGEWILNTALPQLGTWLLELTLALWHWIQDAAPPALQKLAELLAALGTWIITEGIPRALVFLGQLAVKFVDWITDLLPQIPPKLGEFIGKIAAWLLTTGIPNLVETIAKLEVKLLEFIVNAARNAPGKLVEFIGAVVGWLRDKGPGLLGEAAGKLTDALLAPFKAAFNMIAGFWNDTVGKVSFTVPDWVPLAGGKGFSFPKMPVLHQGGIVPGAPGSDVLGILQAGELVIPRLDAAALAAIGAGAPGGSAPIIGGDLVLQGAAMTPADLTVELAWYAKTSGR